MTVGPPDRVLRAFGARGSARPLPGGQDRSWVAAGLVLKPGTGPVAEWLGETLTGVVADGFRLASPVRSRHGTWCWQGWGATRWVDGREPDHADPDTWPAVITAGRAFHRAVAHLPRPAVLATRDDPWAVADRAAWGEQTVALPPGLADVARRLRAALGPLGPSQLVHGDLTGNVLLAAGRPPAVIDVSPYWRPPAFAEGVVVADAIAWHGASAALLDQVEVPVGAVARALLFRLVTTSETARARPDDGDLTREAQRYDRAASVLGL